MKPHKLSFLLMVALVLGACRGGQPAEAPETAAATASPYDVYGEAITDEGAVPVQAVVAEPDQYVDRTVKIEGTVAEVCQERGCWLTFRTGDGNNVRVVVPRKEDGSDYVFTVPKDISGRRVVAEGTLAEVALSEHAQHHMAEDAGETVEAGAPAPGPELQLTARGVLVEKADT